MTFIVAVGSPKADPQFYCVTFGCMSKTIPLISFAIIMLLSACKQSSFLKQRYTQYGHSKSIANKVEKTRKTTLVLNLQPVAMQAKAEHADVPQQRMPKRSEEFTPALACSAPVQQNKHNRDLTPVETIATNAMTSASGLKKAEVFPIKFLRSVVDRAERIPVISPLLKIVFLLLLIVLVALVIFLVMIL
jgi:hypothetical protein